MHEQERINYVELPASDIEASKIFFSRVFNWKFQDYGADYAAFTEPALNGGFYRSNKRSTTENGSALIVFYSDDLQQTEQKIRHAGGVICKPIFSFPGGRRFHFTEPSGNEFAVWSDKGME